MDCNPLPRSMKVCCNKWNYLVSDIQLWLRVDYKRATLLMVSGKETKDMALQYKT